MVKDYIRNFKRFEPRIYFAINRYIPTSNYTISHFTGDTSMVAFATHVQQLSFGALYCKFNNYNFVVKPFKFSQMTDIIKNFFISYETYQKNIKITHDLIFRPETKILLNKKNNMIINLTEKESKLLNFILENKENVLKKDEILINVWGITERINTHTLETHIYSLKKKLDAFEYNHSFICSDNLGGYYFNKIIK